MQPVRVLVGLTALTVGFIASADTHYVVPQGTEGNTPTAPYTSWETAANDIATAVAAAGNNDTVLVRKGTYAVPAQISITQSNLKLRSYDPNTGTVNAEGTVLTPTPDGTYDNALVWTKDWVATTIDGFTFKNATRGLYMYGTRDAKVLNCRFVGNSGGDGAGAYLWVCDGAVVSNCLFASNVSTGSGGGVYLQNGSDAETTFQTFIDCVFTNNTAAKGGAVYSGRSIHADRCTFRDNVATAEGGHLRAGIHSRISGSTFSGKAGGTYGEVLFFQASDVAVSNCTFTALDFSAGSFGTILTQYGGLVTDCAFTNNVRIKDTYIMNLQSPADKPFVVRNCLFADNGTSTGIVRGHDASGVSRFENCTIVANGTIAGTSSTFSSNEWVNCILLGTQPTTSGRHVNVIRSCQTEDPHFVSEARSCYRLRSDSPCVDAGEAMDWHADAGDLDGRTRVVGSAVDIGCYERQVGDMDYWSVSRVVASETDKTGDWVGATTDFQAAIDATGDDGLVLVRSGTYAIGTTLVISNRILTVKSCDPETGAPDRDGTVLDGQGRTRILFTHWGETKPNESTYDECVPAVQHPVLIEGFTFKDGLTAADDGLFDAGKGGGLLMYGRAKDAGLTPSRVVGCRFTGCSAVNGGGIALRGGRVENCVFDGNTASWSGGGAASVQPVSARARQTCYALAETWYAPSFVGCTFTNNVSAKHGGGVAFSDADGTVLNGYVVGCGFFDNRIEPASGPTGYGSAMTVLYGGTVSNCVFRGNSGAQYGVLGGGDNARYADLVFTGNSAQYAMIYAANSSTYRNVRMVDNAGSAFMGYGTIVNSLFANTDGTSTLATYYDNKKLTCESCTFVNTRANVVWPRAAGTAISMTDCILWREGGAPFGALAANNTVVLTNCCLSAELPEEGFTVVDPVYGSPRFRNAAAGDWSIRHSSSCRDRGKMLDWMTTTTDLAGNPRVVTEGRPLAVDPAALPDIGCYENQEETVGMLLLLH